VRDPYDILGVDRSATQDEIRSAFKKLAAQHHPDRNQGDPGAAQRFKELNAAYEILKDPEKRAAFDRFGPAMANGGGQGPFGGAVPFDMSDIPMDGIFGDLLGALGIKVGDRGNLTRDLRIRFEEAAFGCTKELTYDRVEACDACAGSGGEPGTKLDTCGTCQGRGRIRVQQGMFPVVMERACPKCSGTGRLVTTPCRSCHGAGLAQRSRAVEVTIPAGIENGASRLVERGGNVPKAGRPPGDLEIVIRVEPHEVFRRVGDDLVCSLPVTFPTAALGGEIALPTLEGKDGRLKIPAGTQPGSVLRVRGKGVPRRVVGGRGDLLVEVKVEVPTQLSAEARAAIEQLAAVLGSEPAGSQEEAPNEPGFFDRLKNLFS
jgi:molecular chaperone DnaJ